MEAIDRLGIKYDVPLAPVRMVREVVNDNRWPNVIPSSK